MREKLLTIYSGEYVNKIKYEEWKEFENSIFNRVYYSAIEATKTIIEFNAEYKKIGRESGEKYCNENQIFNIISFLGERGMGKSSAMLSFAYYLKQFHTIEDKKGRLELNDKEKIKFFVLPKIDTAMMGAGENLLDVVLAKMWDAFEEKASSHDIKENDYKYAKDNFSKVKSSYSEYLVRLKENKSLKKTFKNFKKVLDNLKTV